MKTKLLYSCLITMLLLIVFPACRQAPNGTSSLVADKDTESVAQTPMTLYGASLDGMQVSKATFVANENLSEVLMRYGVSAQKSMDFLARLMWYLAISMTFLQTRIV